MTRICGIRLMVRRAANVTIHVIPDDAFEDWIVRDEGGRKLGRFATREAAELVARALARRRGGMLVTYKSFEKGLAGAMLAR
jgi:hypothetical protein